MMRLIGILLSLWLIFSSTPVMAESLPPKITEEQFQQLDDLANSAFAATNKGDFAKAETYWTQIIDKFPTNAAAWSNRGNARVSQNKLAEALADYNKSVELAPQVTDPYLNRVPVSGSYPMQSVR